jgi:hypothetical protein
VASDRPAKWLQAHLGRSVAVGYADGTVVGGKLEAFDEEWLELRDDGGHRVLCALEGARLLVEMTPGGVALPPRGGLNLAPRP